jgi:hypothetical protein
VCIIWNNKEIIKATMQGTTMKEKLSKFQPLFSKLHDVQVNENFRISVE